MTPEDVDRFVPYVVAFIAGIAVGLGLCALQHLWR